MPIEIVCKIKFAEEDAKPKEKEAGDEQSLLGAAQGAAAPRDLATFASTSTLHGLGRACGPGPHGLRRTLWALALLTSLAAFLYQAAGLARGYLTRPHLVVMDPAAPAPAAGFPAVTLCNINRFRHSALSDADIFHLANLTGLPPKDRDGHRAAGLRYPEPDMVDILNRTGHQLADMLKSCNFSGHHCSASNFSVVSPARRPGRPGVAGGLLWGCGWRAGHPRQGFPSFRCQRLASCHPPAWCFPRGSLAGSSGRSWGLTQPLLLLLRRLSCCRSARVWGAGVLGWAWGGLEASQFAGKGCTRPWSDQLTPAFLLLPFSPVAAGFFYPHTKQGRWGERIWGLQQGRDSGLRLGEPTRLADWIESIFADTGCQCLSPSLCLSHTPPFTNSLTHPSFMLPASPVAQALPLFPGSCCSLAWLWLLH